MDRLRNPGKVKAGLTWADILAEEPFEGQHWEGVYGLPPSAVRPPQTSGSLLAGVAEPAGMETQARPRFSQSRISGSPKPT